MPAAAASNEYRDYDIEAGHHNNNNRRDDNTRQCPPSTIIQLGGKLPFPSPDHTENSTDVDEQRSRRSRSRSHSRSRSRSRGPSKTLKKQLARFFRANGRHGSGPEQSSLLQPTLTSGGTFDTQASTNDNVDGDYEYPRSQSRMTNKWGNIKDQMNPDQWMRALESAQSLGWGSGLSDGRLMSREELMEHAQEKIRTLGEINVWHCLVAVLIYIGISVACFSFWLEEKWTIVDSIYFAFVTFTTIGYGDIVPGTRMARLFTCVWALSGVACLGIALGVLGSELVEVAEQDKKKARDKHKAEMIDMFNAPSEPKSNATGRRDDGTTSQWSDLSQKGVEDDLDTDDDEADSAGGCKCVFSKKLRRFLWLSIFVVVTLHFIAIVEGWTVWSTLYYGIITASTVGYGDLSPQTQTGRMLAILYIPVAVGVMGSFLDVVANSIIARQKQGAENYWQHKELSLKDLRAMDSDGDGTVSKAEFLEFMLIATDQVSKEALDNLKDHFDRLDKDGSGSLDKADLISMAQSKLDSERMLSKNM